MDSTFLHLLWCAAVATLSGGKRFQPLALSLQVRPPAVRSRRCANPFLDSDLRAPRLFTRLADGTYELADAGADGRIKHP